MSIKPSKYVLIGKVNEEGINPNKYQLKSNMTDNPNETSSTKYPSSKALSDAIQSLSEQQGIVLLIAMGEQPSTPYKKGTKWFYNGKIYTATSTTATDDGVVPDSDTKYMYNGNMYWWNGTSMQIVDDGDYVHITGTETITGNKTFSGSVALGDNATAQTKPTSDTSDAPATTKFVKDFAQDGEWQKPDDWVDIRSGALDNSIYFLVAHRKPTESEGVYSIATYPKFAILASISTSANTYDVFVDGIKVATTNSGTKTEIDWASLYNQGIINSGYDIASPGSSNYTTHIVRITPSVSTDTVTACRIVAISGQANQGCLWMHFELSNAIDIHNLCGLATTQVTNYLLQAITAKDDTITYTVSSATASGLYGVFAYTSVLVKIPILKAASQDYSGGTYISMYNTSANPNIKNNSEKLEYGLLTHFYGKKIDIENPIRFHCGTGSGSTITNLYNLKKLPKISTKEKGETIVITRADSLEPTFIDESFNDQRKLLRIDGASGYQTNLIGLVVSNSAPFNYATAPQLSIKYTNMDRAALVNLFNSMPTVSDSQEIDVTGATGAGDLTVEDIAIATGKGWTVTR